MRDHGPHGGKRGSKRPQGARRFRRAGRNRPCAASRPGSPRGEARGQGEVLRTAVRHRGRRRVPRGAGGGPPVVSGAGAEHGHAHPPVPAARNRGTGHAHGPLLQRRRQRHSGEQPRRRGNQHLGPRRRGHGEQLSGLCFALHSDHVPRDRSRRHPRRAVLHDAVSGRPAGALRRPAVAPPAGRRRRTGTGSADRSPRADGPRFRGPVRWPRRSNAPARCFSAWRASRFRSCSASSGC